MAGPPPLSPAGGQDSATPEAQTADEGALPSSGLETLKEEGELLCCRQAGEGSAAGLAAAPEEAPAVDEAAHEAGAPPTLPRGGEGLCPDSPDLDSGMSSASPAVTAEQKDSAAARPEPRAKARSVLGRPECSGFCK